MTNEPYDLAKMKRIIDVLIGYPDGLWLRRLALEAKVAPSTLHRYVEGFLAPFIENLGAKNEKGHFFGVRLVRLKPGVRKRLQEGVPLEQLLKTGQVFAEKEL